MLAGPFGACRPEHASPAGATLRARRRGANPSRATRGAVQGIALPCRVPKAASQTSRSGGSTARSGENAVDENGLVEALQLASPGALEDEGPLAAAAMRTLSSASTSPGMARSARREARFTTSP